jgi:hypothetical protein
MDGASVSRATPGRLRGARKASENRLGSAHPDARKTVDKSFTLLAPEAA